MSTIADLAAREIASQDIFSSGCLVEAVLRPTSPADVMAAVRACAEDRIAILPRGGGMS